MIDILILVSPSIEGKEEAQIILRKVLGAGIVVSHSQDGMAAVKRR